MKKHLRLTKLGSLEAGTRFWFAKFFVGKEGTVIFQSNKGIPYTGYHFGHEYDIKAHRRKAHPWRSVWVEVK